MKLVRTSGLVGLLILLSAPATAYACICMGQKPPCQAAWEAEAVFVGTVLSSSESGPIKFAVDKSFRGLSSNVVEVSTGGTCGFHFQGAQQYLVYAYKGETGRLETSICTRTRQITDATEDLAYLQGLSQAPAASAINGEVQFHKRDADGNVNPSPLPSVRVNVEGDTGQSHVLTDENGSFSIKDLAPGSYRVSLELPKGLSAGPEEQKVTVIEKGCSFVYFGVESDGRLSGRVLSVSQIPIAGAEIQIMAAGRERFRGYWNSTNSNAQGLYEFSKIPPGKYVLLIRFDGASGQNKPFPKMYYPGVPEQSEATVIEIGEGQRRENYNLNMPGLPKQRTIEGTVISSDGRLITNAKVAYGADAVVYAVPMMEPGHFRLKIYEGVKISLEAQLDIGNGKRISSEWLEVPVTSDMTDLKLVIPSHLIPK